MTAADLISLLMREGYRVDDCVSRHVRASQGSTVVIFDRTDDAWKMFTQVEHSRSSIDVHDVDQVRYLLPQKVMA